MKMIEIKFNISSQYDEDTIDTLLVSGIKNDYIFENAYIYVRINSEPIDVLYRKFWEDVYLQRNHQFGIKYMSDDFKTCDMNLSINEAMMCIEQMSPPRLKHLVKEIKSVKEIIGALKEFLITKSDMSLTYHSFFKSVLHYSNFEIQFDEYDKTTQEKLSTFNNTINKPLIFINYCSDNNLIKDTINKTGSCVDKVNCLFMFTLVIAEYTSEEDIKYLFNMIDKNEFKVNRIYHDDNLKSYYVSITLDKCINFDNIIDYIKTSYIFNAKYI